MQTVLDNAKALEKGLKSTGAELFCSPTENHLVLVKLPEDDGSAVDKLEQAGLLVKAENLLTADDKIFYPILRLSTLDPTTRALTEDDMYKVGVTLGEFLKSKQDADAIKKVKKFVERTVENLPLFSEDWLPEDEIINDRDADLMVKSMVYGM